MTSEATSQVLPPVNWSRFHTFHELIGTSADVLGKWASSILQLCRWTGPFTSAGDDFSFRFDSATVNRTSQRSNCHQAWIIRSVAVRRLWCRQPKFTLPGDGVVGVFSFHLNPRAPFCTCLYAVVSLRTVSNLLPVFPTLK